MPSSRAATAARRQAANGWTQVRGLEARVPVQVPPHRARSSPQYVIERLRDLTEGQDVVWTTDVGQHQMWAAQYLKIEQPRNWLTSGGLGTMGFGLPAAIGAKVGRPDAIVIDIDGDGCFQMTMQELATAEMYGIARSTSPSSTTDGWGWCASGRSCSTTSASPRPT